MKFCKLYKYFNSQPHQLVMYDQNFVFQIGRDYQKDFLLAPRL